MTVEEAKAIIERKSSIPMGNETFEYVSEAYDIAVEALEKVQALEENETYFLYREYLSLGTVEELKAIKQWKADIIESFSKYDVNSVDEMMKRFRELTEKAEPKKPIVEEVCNGKYTLERFYCSVCKQKIISRIDGDWFSGKCSKYCDECGTAIDWE